MGLILVVEDNALVVDAMRALLEATGHEVSTASSVEETVERCRERMPSLMLLDITLPDGSGLDALARLAADVGCPPITVALTGHDDPALTRACREAGCRAVLLKPVPARELMRLVREWVDEVDAVASASAIGAGERRSPESDGEADRTR